jgi:peptidoglycan/xylan/chitin deacetylase (PgdA/CDA1 family)
MASCVLSEFLNIENQKAILALLQTYRPRIITNRTMPHLSKPPPLYYSSLPPFKELFRTGLPILTYHKIGRRPLGARLKGLYLSQSLFRSQLRELRRADFALVSLAVAGKGSVPKGRPIVFTFDDGFRSVVDQALEPLAEHRWGAIVFLVSRLLGKTNEWDVPTGEKPEPLMDVAQVRDWLAAGNEIGSHSLTHPRLSLLPEDQAREEISASRKQLEDVFGVSVEHFCYPYGDWNERVRDLVAAAGYRTACTTEPGINTSDTHPFALKRITARYPTRSLRNWVARFRRAKA